MAKIKLVVSATIEETFSDFIISKKTKGLAEKTLQSYQSQFQAVARHKDVKMDIAMLQKADLDAMIISMLDASLSPNTHRLKPPSDEGGAPKGRRERYYPSVTLFA